MSDKVKILGVSGSLRIASFNRLLLNNAMELLPANAELEIFSIADLPLFNEDLEANIPDSVILWREKIANADGILFAVPEYNFSLSGVLKNAIDWASRPQGGALARKPAGMIGASSGMVGTARAQMHLRQVFTHLDIPTVNKPEILISFAKDKFDGQGKLIDPMARKFLGEFLTALVTLVEEKKR